MSDVRQNSSIPTAPSGTIRVLVVDDSAVARGLIAQRLRSDLGIEVVATAADGAAALRALQRTPADVVVLDVEMPGVDGLTALPMILAAQPGIRVLMASSFTRRNAEVTLRALQLGAHDFLPKPDGGRVSAEDFHLELRRRVKALAAPGQTPPAASAAAAPPQRTQGRHARPQVIAIGASTGGPPALLAVLEGLRGVETPPILITQHMPATFTALLAEQLSRACGRECREAQEGEPALAGRAYIAPGGFHMRLARDGAGVTLRLDQGPAEHYCRPAVDPMLRSAAEIFGAGVLAVVLTGMGGDGAAGCRAVSAAGGRFVAQDAATSVVWGMPGAAAQTGLSEAVLPLSEIAPWLRRQLAA